MSDETQGIDGGAIAEAGGAGGDAESFLAGFTSGSGGVEPQQPPPQQPGDVSGDGVADVPDVDPETGRPAWCPEKFWDATERKVKDKDLAAAHAHLEKYMGSEKVPVPKDDDEAAWDMYYKAGGWPESPDKYQVDKATDLPAGMTYDEDLHGTYLNWAHASKLNNKQVKTLYDGFVKHQIDRQIAWQKEREDARRVAENAFVREYGKAADATRKNVGGLLQKYTDPDFMAVLEENGMANDPRVVRVFARIHKDMAGVAGLKGQPEGRAGAMSAPQLEEKIAQFRKTHQKALMSADDPAHDLRVKQLMELHEQFAEARGSNRV